MILRRLAFTSGRYRPEVRVESAWRGAAPVVALIAALAMLPGRASGCSLIMSDELEIAPHRWNADPVPVTVEAVSIEPWIDDCEAGFMVVTLRGEPTRRFRHQGYYVRPVSGVHGARMFPTTALAPDRRTKNTVTISWYWGTITFDADGHIRWRFEIVPVSRAGVLGAPVVACVSTDDSC